MEENYILKMLHTVFSICVCQNSVKPFEKQLMAGVAIV